MSYLPHIIPEFGIEYRLVTIFMIAGGKIFEEGTLKDIHGDSGGHEDEAVIKTANEELTLFH